MAKKQHFILVDTETTINDHVADIGIIICDRQGNIQKSLSVLVADYYLSEELFHDKNANDIWGYGGLIKRKANYAAMLQDGRRMLASVTAINKWIAQAASSYPNAISTAYNVAFDKDKCQKSAITLFDAFPDSFCLWHGFAAVHGDTKKYRQFVLDNHLMNSPTQLGNMTYKTNAECAASYIAGAMLEPEPHTAYEDAKDYELPILLDLVKRKNWRERIKPYSWRDYQVKNAFIAK